MTTVALPFRIGAARCLGCGLRFPVKLPMKSVAPECVRCGGKGRRCDRWMPTR